MTKYSLPGLTKEYDFYGNINMLFLQHKKTKFWFTLKNDFELNGPKPLKTQCMSTPYGEDGKQQVLSFVTHKRMTLTPIKQEKVEEAFNKRHGRRSTVLKRQIDDSGDYIVKYKHGWYYVPKGYNSDVFLGYDFEYKEDDEFLMFKFQHVGKMFRILRDGNGVHRAFDRKNPAIVCHGDYWWELGEE